MNKNEEVNSGTTMSFGASVAATVERAGTPRARPSSLFLLGEKDYALIYPPEARQEIAHLTKIVGSPQTRESIQDAPKLLEEAEIIFSGWGAPKMDEAFLRRAPNLRAVFYGAGTVGYFVTEAFWRRDIVLTSAWAANAVPVAQYTLGVILLSLKHFWKYAAHAKAGGLWGDQHRLLPGGYRTTVGLVSFGMIARTLSDMLSPFELSRLVYCPFLTPTEAAGHGVELAGLEEVFQRADVISLHCPMIPETRGLITGQHIASMKYGATLINTARGGVLRESEMIDVLRGRPDLTVVLDVTDPEPPVPGSALLALPNVIVTPHIAGSHHRECWRMGAAMLAELKHYLAGEPLQWQITREISAKLA